jgi:hypothetical protein
MRESRYGDTRTDIGRALEAALRVGDERVGDQALERGEQLGDVRDRVLRLPLWSRNSASLTFA